MSSVSLARSVAVAAVLVACGASLGWSNTGWRPDYDFLGQGADWYGTTRYDINRDFGPPPAAVASDGDDFGQGYDALFDHFGYGPPVALTNESKYEFIFRFGDRVSGAFACVSDGECSDGRFCNGAERCDGSTSQCREGRPPECFDGDPCTTDGCSEAGGGCVFVPIGRAPEVASIRVDRYGPDPSFVRIEWDGDPAQEFFNLYRAEDPLPNRFRCLTSGIEAQETLDDGLLPVPGTAFHYLVSAFGCGGESILGMGSNGKEPSFDACP